MHSQTSRRVESFFRFMVLALALVAIRTAAAKADNDKPILAAAVPNNCPNLVGRYDFIGEAVEGYPDYYRGLKVPLTLDRLLGVPIFGKKSSQVTSVEIVAENNLELVFSGPDGVIERRPLGRPEDHIDCEADALHLKQDVVAAGDGAHNDLKITRTISLTPKGIQVHTSIRGTARAFFLFNYDLPPEDYKAVFLRHILNDHSK